MKKCYKIHAIASYLSTVTVSASDKDEALQLAKALDSKDFEDIEASRSLNIVDCHEIE